MRRICCLIAALVVIGFVWAPRVSATSVEPWPQYGQNAQHTGRSPFSGPRTNKIFSSFIFDPQVSDQWGTLLIDSQNAVYAQVRSGGSGNDYTINRITADGTLVWTSNRLCCGQAPVIDQNDVFYFFDSPANLFRARRPDGTIAFSLSLPNGGYGGQFITSDAGNNLYVTYTSYGWLGGISSFDSSGNLRWQQYGMFGPGIPAISPDNQTIYVKDIAQFSDSPSILWAINASNGSVKWSISTGGTSPPMVTPDGMLVFTQYTSILAITPNGAFLWQKLFGTPWTNGYTTNVLLTKAGNITFIVHTSSENRLIVLNPSDGSEIASHAIPFGDVLGITGAVIDADDVIYFGTNDFSSASGPVGTLYAFSLETGTFVWQRTFSNAVIQSNMAIDNNGHLRVMVADYGQGHFFLHTIGEHPGFLRFPLRNKGPYDAKINSVFDHSMDKPYCPDGVVTAYTGEEGKFQKKKINRPFPDCDGDGRKETLYGFANKDGTDFSVGGQYVGGGEPKFLFYDGHPGYDYRTTDQQLNGDLCPNESLCNYGGRTEVLAAASGIVVCPGKSASCLKNFGEIRINHGNGYFTVYLHLSKPMVKEGDIITQEQVDHGKVIGISGETGAEGNPHLHFEVQLDIGGIRIPVDPYGWNKEAGDDPYKKAVNVKLWK